MFILQGLMAAGHLFTEIYKKVVEWNYIHLVAAAAWEAYGPDFREWDHVLDRV